MTEITGRWLYVFAQLDDIFRAWKAANDALPDDEQVSVGFPSLYSTTRIPFDYDRKTFRSSVGRFKINGVPQTDIELPVYELDENENQPPRGASENGNVPLGVTNYSDEDVEDIHRLPEDTVRTSFPHLLAGCKSILGIDDAEPMRGQVIYHTFDGEFYRMFFLFEKEDGTARIYISFDQDIPWYFNENDENQWGRF